MARRSKPRIESAEGRGAKDRNNIGTTGGSGREWVPGHYNPWIFQRRDACWGVTEKRTTPPLLFIALPSLPPRPKLHPPLTDGAVHHCTLFIPRNLNYTFNRNDAMSGWQTTATATPVRDVSPLFLLLLLFLSADQRKNVNSRAKSGKHLTCKLSIIWKNTETRGRKGEGCDGVTCEAIFLRYFLSIFMPDATTL